MRKKTTSEADLLLCNQGFVSECSEGRAAETRGT